MTFLNDLSPSFVKFCMDLSICAYTNDFKENTPNILFKNFDNKISQPVFYILNINKSLFIVTRGAASAADFQTILDMSETKTNCGTFHNGFYKAAKFVYNKVREHFNGNLEDQHPNDEFIDKSDNLLESYENVYFVGHSYGGAVSASLILLFGNLNYRAVIFGAPPVVDLEHCSMYNKCIASFVAEHDLIPTLSVPNIANQLRARMSSSFEKENLPSEDEMINEFNKLLDSFDTDGVPAGNEVVASLKKAAPLFIGNVVQLIRERLDKVVRYVPGCVYRITRESTARLIECKVNPTDELGILSACKSAVADHPPGSYESCLNALIE
ncbi:hypothetical protein TRFO_24057 [Tritrichomonas foetus]|uniref:sn-1-specific diacylglycerol lipase n=1 Tax=Tritrichomonas foetus TaxID=1144522 RepID=A0A1J4K9W7_9EUKA|nr:hypothetical protein TRFO_24057 [Tritrichomonas foetus]|eukprot:OHT07704.1 hypothetical protein TRFO_24057 [Tritrichomonas foetus]